MKACKKAYYLGRMGVHLLVSVVATFLFSVTLYWLLAPQCSFGALYLVFFLVHLACAGLGFWTSVVLSPSLSGLVGILGVLSFVLFGGSMFVFGVAFPPVTSSRYVLPLAFYGISLFSPLRWAYELVVLTIM